MDRAPDDLTEIEEMKLDIDELKFKIIYLEGMLEATIRKMIDEENDIVL